MKVELVGQYWNGDRSVPKAESGILVCNGLLVDGEPVWCTHIRLDLETSIPLFYPDTGKMGDPKSDFVVLWLDNVYFEHAERLLSDPDNCAYGSTAESLGVIVSELSFLERYPHPEPEPVAA